MHGTVQTNFGANLFLITFLILQLLLNNFLSFFLFKMPLKMQTSMQHVNHLSPRWQLGCKAQSIHIYFMKSTCLWFSLKTWGWLVFFPRMKPNPARFNWIPVGGSPCVELQSLPDLFTWVHIWIEKSRLWFQPINETLLKTQQRSKNIKGFVLITRVIFWKLWRRKGGVANC